MKYVYIYICVCKSLDLLTKFYLYVGNEFFFFIHRYNTHKKIFFVVLISIIQYYNIKNEKVPIIIII